MTTYRVVFHLDEVAKPKPQMVLNNIKNLIVDLGPNADWEIDVVANGEGVLAFLTTHELYTDDVERLAEMGVNFLICGNSLKAMHVPEDALLGPVAVIPAGVTRIVARQMAGWAYVRP
jgi:hypothetical protein